MNETLRTTNLAKTKATNLADYRRDLESSKTELMWDINQIRTKANIIIPSCLAPDSFLDKEAVNDEVSLSPVEFFQVADKVSVNIQDRINSLDQCLSWIWKSASSIAVWDLREWVAWQFDSSKWSWLIAIDREAVLHLWTESDGDSTRQSLLNIIHHEYSHDLNHKASMNDDYDIIDNNNFLIEGLNSLYAYFTFGAPIPSAYQSNVSHIESKLSQSWIGQNEFCRLYSEKWIQAIAIALKLPLAFKLQDAA